MRWMRLLKLALCLATKALGSPSAADYLSEEAFPGLHILEREGDGPSLKLPTFKLHRMGQHPDKAGVVPKTVDTSAWTTMDVARAELEKLLKIPPREPLESDWAIFTSQGRRVNDVADLLAQSVAFVCEIGVWLWPPVRIGFEHVAQGVHGEGSAILRTLSLRPVVYEVRDFITKSECEEVMKIGGQQGLHESLGVMQSADLKKKTQHKQFRTSTQAWLQNELAPVVAELDERVANLTRVPASHNEAVQLLRYNEGQYYHGHMDWTELELYPDQRNIWLHSHFGHQDRLATVFWYLNDVEVGGETIFPKHGQPVCDLESSRGGGSTRYCKGAPDPDMKSCEKGLKVPPRRGTVILWYNYHASGRGDRNALHAGCPVGSGLTKWSANKWVRIKPAWTPPGGWVADHPALKRHGWVEKGAPRVSEICEIVFTNQASVSADLMWQKSPGNFMKLVSIPAGGQTSQQSYQGHVFQLWSGDKKSNGVSCKMPGGNFLLTSDFNLKEDERAFEL